MSVQEACNICGGSGWKITERDGISGAEKCLCQDIGLEGRMEERANIPPLYQNASVENFILPSDNPVARTPLATAVITVRGYVRDYPNVPKRGLLFLGGSGCGKTHLAVAALRGLIARGFEGIFFDYQTLLNQIYSGYDKSSGTFERNAYKLALDTPILLLDDIGAHRANDFVEDIVTSIITHRCNHQNATIITTNLRDPEIGNELFPAAAEHNKEYYLEHRVGTRTRSRLYEMCRLIKMPDEDYRQKKRG